MAAPCMGPHLVFLLQVLHSAQALAKILGSSQQQLLLHPGHFLVSIPEELQEEAPSLQGCPALLQGLLKTLKPAAVASGWNQHWGQTQCSPNLCPSLWAGERRGGDKDWEQGKGAKEE